MGQSYINLSGMGSSYYEIPLPVKFDLTSNKKYSPTLPPEETINLAKENNFLLLRTKYYMFEACGIIYELINIKCEKNIKNKKD